MPAYQHLQYQVEDRIAYITINRPDKRNSLNDVLIAELRDAVLRSDQDEGVKIMVLRANGPIFCAGMDLDYLQRMQAYTFEQNLADSTALAQLFLTCYRASKVIIAQVEGPAIAGGCGLLTVCDFVFAVPEARFAYTEVRIGFVPAIVSSFLIRKAGETRAKELLLSGDSIDAATAERYHLITRVIAADRIAGDVQSYARSLCERNSAASMQMTKRLIADLQDLPLEPALAFAAKMNAHARATEDCKRGIAAFLNKEKLIW
jgi:methylglutaconyl-CoA hydratase